MGTPGCAMAQENRIAADGGAEMPSAAEAVLSHAQTDRVIIQDFCPLADSIEWQLGQRYWSERGNQAFLSDSTPVPYVINNDGTLSRHAAELLFVSLVEAEKAGPLPPQLCTLELGIGVGLFARFFLDAFAELCRRHGKDYYDRLQYVAGDYSERMLVDAGRNGIFRRHPGHYLLRRVDALSPEPYLLGDPLLRPWGRGPSGPSLTTCSTACRQPSWKWMVARCVSSASGPRWLGEWI